MLSVLVCVHTCFACSLTWCLPLLAAKACQLLRDKNKNRGEQRGDTRYTSAYVCVCVLLCACILQAASPWDRARWSPQAKQVGPVYLLHSGSCQFRFQLSRNTAQASLPKAPHLTALLLFFLSFLSFLSASSVSLQGLSSSTLCQDQRAQLLYRANGH